MVTNVWLYQFLLIATLSAVRTVLNAQSKAGTVFLLSTQHSALSTQHSALSTLL
ncbi:hypothetical protein [Argonema antarcticum]|uniref:hypothetical protein n=1 Tax=Argonema antarcticum TaxID=2942763 RepID=UPI0020134D72|nr:hypothetical protein [Argonema antarcticum]MCL1473041.1 hypothetical protein [Argonema antarcticum A004/B2]